MARFARCEQDLISTWCFSWNEWWEWYWFQEPLPRNFSLLEVPGGNLREWNFAYWMLGDFNWCYDAYMDSTGAKTRMHNSGASQQSFCENGPFHLQESPVSPSVHPHSSLPYDLESRGIDQPGPSAGHCDLSLCSDCPKKSSFSFL